MNVLFYTTFEVSPEKGGTERITSTIATGLKRIYGVKCYSVYSSEIESSFEKTEFERRQKLSYKTFAVSLRKFVVDNEIDIIVNQGAFALASDMRQALKGFTNKHLLLVHHFNPGAEENFFTFRKLIYEIRCNKEVLKNTVKVLLYPILRKKYCYQLKRDYRIGYECSDAVVLLSDNFRSEYMSYADINDKSKFRTIHNSLSFNSFFDMKDYEKKKKEVLIVSRLDERQKRISLALKIWAEIEKDIRFEDWTLRIVGHGDMDINKYYAFVKNNNLKRVFFEGAQKSLQYYQRASLFMLTSSFEGWGLTLTEAQQNACLPIAFCSYSSLIDIITDGYDGRTIEDNDIDEYVNALASLMSNGKQRKEMASNAVNSSHRFEVKKICKCWMDLFHEISNKD